jgi:hypothetical protein
MVDIHRCVLYIVREMWRVDTSGRTNFIIVHMRCIIRATELPRVLLLLVLMVGSLRRAGLIMP